MTPKLKKMKMHRIVLLSQLLVEDLDELKVTSAETLKYKNDLIGFIELLVHQISDTDTVQKTTYFQDIANKIDTIIRKSFNENM